LFSLIALLVVIWLALMGFLAIWTLVWQGYIYTEPVSGIAWRAPAAGSALTLFLILWVAFDYNSPGRYRALQEFNPSQDLTPYKELRIITPDGKEEAYRRMKGDKGQPVYRLDGRPAGRELPSRPREVIVKEDHQDVIFKPDRDAKGHFKVETGQSLQYQDAKGRVMDESRLGEITVFRTGNLLANLVLNFLHLGVWFAVLWLLLEFRFWDAMGLAVVFWGAIMLFLLPPTLGLAERVAGERSAVQRAGGVVPLTPVGHAHAALRTAFRAATT